MADSPSTAVSIASIEEIFSYSHWLPQLKILHQQYRSGTPFQHIVLENFLVSRIADQALGEFPPIDSNDWIHYLHVNEKKFGKTNRASFPPVLGNIIDELNSPKFIDFLAKLTGIRGLFADKSLEGGGLHQSKKGGFLNIHADFTVHPHHRTWKRRINVLIYLNKNWKDEYGGHLELWDRKITQCVKKIAPLFNRCVIFNTDRKAFHGHPEPLTCPPETTRKSIALYYFSQYRRKPPIRSTEYRTRPGEGIKRLWVYLDKLVLHIYDATKRRVGINDKFASNVLKAFHWIVNRSIKKRK